MVVGGCGQNAQCPGEAESRKGRSKLTSALAHPGCSCCGSSNTSTLQPLLPPGEAQEGPLSELPLDLCVHRADASKHQCLRQNIAAWLLLCLMCESPAANPSPHPKMWPGPSQPPRRPRVNRVLGLRRGSVSFLRPSTASSVTWTPLRAWL